MSTEHRSLFRPPFQATRFSRPRRQNHPYRPVRKVNVQSIWTHKFFCLACVGTRTLPMSKAAKEVLVVMNLGEKVVSVPSNASPSDLHSSILEAFPPLGESGGYTLLRCTGNTKTLEVLEPPPGGQGYCRTSGDYLKHPSQTLCYTSGTFLVAPVPQK